MAETNRHRDSAQNPPGDSPADGSSSAAGVGWFSQSILSKITGNDLRLQGALFVFMLLWYGALLGISWRLSLNDPVRLTFNSMLDHLLRGRFDVDPQIVGYEGYLSNGRVYAYFGIWCALLRVPLWIANRMNVDMTYWSCLTAVCLASMAKVRALLLIRRRAIGGRVGKQAVRIMFAYVLLAGSAVAVLQVSIYEEVILWAYAFAAVFVYFGLKGVIHRSFSTGMLCAMAACAGLGLLTRASTGVGLVGAFLILLLVVALKPAAAEMSDPQATVSRFGLGRGRMLVGSRMLAPLAILAMLIAATAAVNYFRWGNPAMFDNPDLYVMKDAWPNYLSSLHSYGFFNIRRMLFGLMYYFVPVWVLRNGHGGLLFSMPHSPLLGIVNLPPSSFLLTDLPALGFILFLAIAVRKGGGRVIRMSQCSAIAAGLLVPCVLMLGFPWMISRYRMEFYPEFEFLALLGLYLTVSDEAMLATFKRLRRFFRAGLMVSIVASIGVLALCDIDGDASPDGIVRSGVVHYYVEKVAYHLHRFSEHGLRSQP
jgi:hypothetical protein